jgi:predicted enzyme related to lactoylglutathione lyase
MGNPVVHFEIFGKDAPGLRAFYGEAFGWQFGEPVGPNAYMLVRPDSGAGIGGGIGASPDVSYQGHVTFYIEVPDVARSLEAIEKRGGTKVMGPEAVPGGPIIGLFRDPEGHVIGLVQKGSA